MSSLSTSTLTSIGAAAIIAAFSAYWITSSSRQSAKSKDDSLKLVLDRLEEMQERLSGLEKVKKTTNNTKQQQGGTKQIGSKIRGKNSSRQNPLSQAKANSNRNIIGGGGGEEDADSDANVIPAAFMDDDDDDEDSRNHSRSHRMPHTITTKPKENRTSQFLLHPTTSTGRRQAPHQDSTSHSTAQGRGGGNINTGGTTGAHSTSASTSSPHDPVPVILMSDPGQDLDDEMMFIMARHLVSLDLISLQGVIANLSPSFARARLTRGTLDLLGLHRVPVGIGTDGGDVAGKHSSDQFETTARSYIVQDDGEAARGLESGHRLLQRLYEEAPDIEYVDEYVEDTSDETENNEAENKMKEEKLEFMENAYSNAHNKGSRAGTDAATGGGSTKLNNGNNNNTSAPTKKVVKGGLTIVITSSMKDIAIFVRDNPTLFASKTREVVVMGGCKPIPIDDSKTALAMASTFHNSKTHDETASHTTSHYSASHIWSSLAAVECEPDSAHNNTFDVAASQFFYSQCQKMNITLTVVSRYAAYAAKMPRSVYDDLALTGSSIGWRLRNSQRASIDQLWQRACSQNPTVRKGLPPRCDRKWFIGTFCGGNDDPSRCSADTAWDLVTGFMQYDTIALLAAIPLVRDMYFDPFVLPPLQTPKSDFITDGGCLGQLRIAEEKVLDMSEVTREGDETVTAGGAAERRRSSMDTSTNANLNKPLGRGGVARRRNSYPTNPGGVQRAIARANEDNKYVETPFEAPGSQIPGAFDRGTRNLIGLTDKEHNLKDPSLLVNLLKTGYREGILCNHHTQPHIILHLQLRWDNLADTLLTCLMLRSLWDMRLASVLGVIVSISPSDSDQAKRPPDEVSVSDVEDGDRTSSDENVGGSSVDGGSKRASDVTTESGADDEEESKATSNCPSTLLALAESIRQTLRSIGLAHVKFLIVSGKNMKEHKKQSSEAFLQLYESAPPIGVTLVLTATFTSVWPFAESHPDLFRNKTVRVVHTGGALIWPARWGWAALPFSQDQSDESGTSEEEGLSKGDVTSEQILVPDPCAQNHRLDMSSARMFYKRAQALSVPMVILSRHVAKECCIPRNFFDVLGSHGGEVGKRIYNSERNSLLNLWRCSCATVGSKARGNLPERCDADWFAENFCAGKQAGSEEEVWKSVEAVNLYSPIALLAALPGETVNSYFQTMPFPVRSATHHVIGLTEEVPPRNVINPSELRSLVVQSLLSAALANESEFAADPPPMVPIRMDHETRRRGFSRHGSALGSSVISTISVSSSNAAEEVDMWTFSEAARRELFSRTVAQTSKNAVLPKEKKRKFVMTNDSRIAATIGFIPPQTGDEE